MLEVYRSYSLDGRLSIVLFYFFLSINADLILAVKEETIDDDALSLLLKLIMIQKFDGLDQEELALMKGKTGSRDKIFAN